MSNTHTCPAPPCELQVQPDMFACKRHWFMLPKRIRDEIWLAFRAGTSAEHLAPMAAGVRWYEENICPDEPGARYDLKVARPPLAATRRPVVAPGDAELPVTAD